MHAFKRWRIGIFSKVDEVVAKVENHEALVETAIRELKKEVINARVQLNRVKRDGLQLSQDADEAKQNALLWKERAAKTVTDDLKALECLKRSKKEAARHHDLTMRMTQHHEMEQRLSATVTELERKMELLREKRNVLKTRQTSANALKIAGDGAREFGDDVEEILSRWESKIEGTEYHYDVNVTSEDALETAFREAEEDTALREELEALRRK